MTKDDAQKILNQIREGFGNSYTEACAIECLYLTGDLGTHETVRSKGVDQPLQEESYRARLRERAILVGKSKE
jgi:hypothetical protein